jgi:hypothetical protein
MTNVDNQTYRAGELTIAWQPSGLIGRVSLDGEHWASVEWSEKRQQWCIEDVEGRCLTHTASIRGMSASKEEAVALAEAMVRDGRMPTPAEAKAEADERRRLTREKRDRQPAEQKRQAQRDATEEAFRRHMDADYRERQAQPFYEAFDDAFDLGDPDLWKSNSFASLKPRLIIQVEAAITDLDHERIRAGMRRGWGRWQSVHKFSDASNAKLDRALAIYKKLTGAEWAPRLSKMSQRMAQIAELTAQQEGEAAAVSGERARHG